MQDNEQKKALAEIFKDEDFDSLKSEEGVDEANLDEALKEIAEIKKTIAVNQDFYSSEPSRIAPSYRNDENYAARTFERKTEEILSAIERNRLSAQTDSEIRQINNELRELKNRVYSYDNSPKPEKSEENKTDVDIPAYLSKLEYDVELTRNELISIRKALDKKNDDMPRRTDVTLLGEIAAVRQALGSGDETSRKAGDALAALCIECEKVGTLVKSGAPLSEKISAIEEFRSKISATENVNVSPIASAFNDIIADLNSSPLAEADVAALFDYVKKNSDEAYLEISRKDVEYYLSLSTEVKDHNPEDCLDLLKDALNFKNRVCAGVGSAETDKQYEYLENIIDTINGNADKEHSVFLRKKAIKLVDTLLVLTIKDVYEFRSVKIDKTYEAGNLSPKTVFEIIGEIRNALSALSFGAAGAAVAAKAEDGANGVSDKDSLVADIIDKTVVQLDRLFDDIKDLTESLGTNLLENLSIINDNVNVLKKSIDSLAAQIDAKVKTEDSNAIENNTQSAGITKDAQETNYEAEFNSLSAKLDEALSILKDVKAENSSLRAELAEIKEKVASAVTPDALDSSIKKSMNKLKNELGGLKKQVARSKRDDEIEIDEILGQVDDALKSK